jgi:hypothetical protein
MVGKVSGLSATDYEGKLAKLGLESLQACRAAARGQIHGTPTDTPSMFFKRTSRPTKNYITSTVQVSKNGTSIPLKYCTLCEWHIDTCEVPGTVWHYGTEC